MLEEESCTGGGGDIGRGYWQGGTLEGYIGRGYWQGETLEGYIGRGYWQVETLAGVIGRWRHWKGILAGGVVRDYLSEEILSRGGGGGLLPG